jgi:hypothetical protein
MIKIPTFTNCRTDQDCGSLVASFIEKHEKEEIFFYPFLQKAGAFQFDTDGWGEITFVEMERHRLEEVYWNNSAYVMERDFSKEETEIEFRAREEEEIRLMTEIRAKVDKMIQGELH